MESRGEVAVFTDTNLGTHIAVAVPPDITAADFKRELEKMHFSCFPKVGEIKAYKLMVKRKGCFYHLPESLPIKYAFQGLKGTRFLHMELRALNVLNKPDLSHRLSMESDNHVSNGANVTNSLITDTENATLCNVKKQEKKKKKKKKGKEKKRIKQFLAIKPLEEKHLKSIPHCKKKMKKMRSLNGEDIDKKCPNRNEKTLGAAANESFGFQTPRNEVKPVISSSHMAETPGDRSPKVVSDKRNDNCSNMQVYASPEFSIKTSPRTLTSLLPTDSTPGSSRNKHWGTARVGKRVVIAAKKLRISGSKGRPAFSFYRLRGAIASSTARSSIFEIRDNDD